MSVDQRRVQRKIQTMIVSRPGLMQESLRAGLTSTLRINIVKSIGDGLSALNVIHQEVPELLVLDSNLLEDEIVALLKYVKQDYPTICCLVVTESLRQEQRVLARGADAVWSRHRSTEELKELLAQIYPDH